MFASASPFFGISRGSYADRADAKKAVGHYEMSKLRQGLAAVRAWRVSMRSIDFAADYTVAPNRVSTNPFETPGPEEEPKFVSYRDASGRVHFTSVTEAISAPVTPPPGAGVGAHSPTAEGPHDAALAPVASCFHACCGSHSGRRFGRQRFVTATVTPHH